MLCPQPKLISTDPPLFSPEDPGFEAAVSHDMPDPGELLSALDSILEAPLGAISNDLSALTTLDELLAAASFTRGAFDAAVIAPLLALYGTWTATGDALTAALAGAIAAAPGQLSPPSAPAEPEITADTLCGPCQPTYPQGSEVIIIPIESAPSTPPGAPSGGAPCLNPTASGGYAPGPCPSQTTPEPGSSGQDSGTGAGSGSAGAGSGGDTGSGSDGGGQSGGVGGGGGDPGFGFGLADQG